jgi:hypothetical protein
VTFFRKNESLISDKSDTAAKCVSREGIS